MNDARINIISSLEALRPKDAVLEEVYAKCWQALRSLDLLDKEPALRLFLVDFAGAGDDIMSSIAFTDSAKALFRPAIVIVNWQFLVSLEAAFRSFDLSPI